MIQVYDQTWQLCLRIFNHTSRSPYLKPLCVIRSLHDFLLSIPNDELIYDLGCGDNNLKLFYNTFHKKNIIGIDKSPEADIYNHVPINDDYSQRVQWNQLNSVNYITAINSMHFDNIGRNLNVIMEKLKPGGRLYFTANDFNQLDSWRQEKNWAEIGNVKYFWCGLDYLKEQKDELREYIENDDYVSLLKIYVRNATEHEIIIKDIYEQAIRFDFYFGVLRVIIEKE